MHTQDDRRLLETMHHDLDHLSVRLNTELDRSQPLRIGEQQRCAFMPAL
jgi:ABC-type uncharacterized transport system fused permease/ATPase subunit